MTYVRDPDFARGKVSYRGRRRQNFNSSSSSSVSKEFACNAGDPGLIPGLGRSSDEGIGYPFQHSWVSLVAQLVKNTPAMSETWVQARGQEDPLEKEMAPHSSTLAWKIP